MGFGATCRWATSFGREFTFWGTRARAPTPAEVPWSVAKPTGPDIQCAGDISDRPSGSDELAGDFLGARSEARGDLGGPVPFDDEVNGGLQSGELRVVEHQVNLDRCPVGRSAERTIAAASSRRSAAGVGAKGVRARQVSNLGEPVVALAGDIGSEAHRSRPFPRAD